jgi:regulator of protease activity HflC (stomatin/prohibitin superfamily)
MEGYRSGLGWISTPFPIAWGASSPPEEGFMKVFKVFHVRPNQIGLFRRNQLAQQLSPGIYRFWDWRNELCLLPLSTVPQAVFVSNQEVLTKDNIALRFSYFLLYSIDQVDRFLASFDLDAALQYTNMNLMAVQVESRLTAITHIAIRQVISSINSEEINEKRSKICDFKTEQMVTEAQQLGLKLDAAFLRDLTFPKAIQDLFAKQLEAKIRAKADLENARTAVATARALKNASELMKGDDNIRFIQLLETMTKIASNGKHTFILGELDSLKSPR